MVFYAGILCVLTILNLFREYLTSLLCCFNAFFVKYLYKMGCTCSSTHRGWVQSQLPEALWKGNVEPGSLVLAVDSMVCVGEHGLPENSACCLKVTLAAHEKHRIELKKLFTCSPCSSYCRKEAVQPVCSVTHTCWLSAREQGSLVRSWIKAKGRYSIQLGEAEGFFCCYF